MKGFFRKKLPACLLALAMMASLIPAASAVSADLTFDVDEDSSVWLDADDFWDLYDDLTGGDLEYVEFTGYDDFDDYGWFEADGYDYDDYVSGYELYDSDLDDARFYYDEDDTWYDDDFELDSLEFITFDNIDDATLDFEVKLKGDEGSEYATVRIEVYGSSSGSGDVKLTYKVEPNKEVTVDADDFYDLFDDEDGRYDELLYVEFTDYDDFDDYGCFYAEDYDYDEIELNEKELDYGFFYYDDRDMSDRSDEYDLDTLTFAADRNADDDTLAFDFTMRGVDGDKVYGTLYIEIGKGTSSKADITYEMDADDELTLDADDFYDLFWDESDDDTLLYVEFTDYDDFDDYGWFGADGYDYDDYVRDYELNESDLDDARFYYDDRDVRNDYEFELETLTFYTDRNAKDEDLFFDFTMRGEDGDTVKGTLCISIGGGVTAQGGDIRYTTTYSGRVQINANDIARFFEESYPGYTVQYMVLKGLPSYGSLYYNYYGTSKYGTSSSMRMTEALCDEIDFYFNPSSSQYAMTELTYVPSGVNYCAQIPFTAYGTGSRSVSGTILISVNLDTVPDIYGPTPVNTVVPFPAASIYTAVSQASGLGLAGIQLLELPATNVGTIYVGSGTATRANTSTVYGYSSGNQRISQLRFVPASGYTGSVEIPYVACNSSGVPFASGKLCLGVVRQMEDYSDISATTWCYKYVLELSDAGVISGYSDGTFRPNDTVTYGAALKLIMLAAGYDEQKPVNSNVFSGYLARAKADGLVSGNVDLTAKITRLAVAQIAAKAMGLSITNLSSVQPFTDTTDPYVRALNAAGIVGGYFENGTSTYKPYNTLTRGAMSAIVWRMEQYQ
ncbi:S-layer homology domain-containing protein [uncultured Oscillibacter sp.]|uniref:S-layer homology domain-containing protein n=1 Tax=uncultured Oscillibacter sp. TaxID=876091 RepID=UPI00280480C0|nr:S-layer homology domain-containing protein [uncultured Oscillibacter sp.]